MTIKEFFSFKKNIFFWLNILAILVTAILIIFLVFKGLDGYTRHGQAIMVPDAKGMTITDARDLFAKYNLQAVVSDSTYVKEKSPGSVLEHNPPSGQKVKEGRIIYLTINTLNTPLQVVPDVADNSSYRQAEARMVASGFKLAPPELVKGEKDWVYGVKYNGNRLDTGERVPMGATLTLIVGNGYRYDPNNPDSLEDVSEPDDAVVDESWF